MTIETIVLDFETHWSTDYSLTKMTTWEYIHDPRFQVLSMAWRNLTTSQRGVITGRTDKEIEEQIRALKLERCATVAHNQMFDAGILSFRYGIHPRFMFDTRFLARGMLGHLLPRLTLDAVAEHLGLKRKGHTLTQFKGYRREDIPPELWADIRVYNADDVDTCAGAYEALRPMYPKEELAIQHLVLLMYTKPLIQLDEMRLRAHLKSEIRRKEALISRIGHFTKDDVMSNNKLAAMLIMLGVKPPKKISTRTNKITYAFAKTDLEFTELLSHPNELVRNVVEARLGSKSTIEETRTRRFLALAEKGHPLAVPLLYYGAHTGRLSGTDKLNLQNLPSRGGSLELRKSMLAPPGHVIMAPDLSQIECRLNAWWCGENWLVEMFRQRQDPYCKLASSLFGKSVTKEENPTERFIGKVGELSLGYGVGGLKFHLMLENSLDADTLATLGNVGHISNRAVIIYRQTHARIVARWKELNEVVPYINSSNHLTKWGLTFGDNRIELPNGMYLNYPNLRYKQSNWTYQYGREERKLYGAKLLENIIQALARIVIMDHMLALSKQYRVVLQVHDELVFVVPTEKVEQALVDMGHQMRKPPAWAPDLPVDVETPYASNYGDCK